MWRVSDALTCCIPTTSPTRSTRYPTPWATGDPYVVEHRVRRFDGTYRWFRVSAVRIRDLHSQEIGWYGVDIDIDDQKRTDDALRHSEQRLNRLIETLPAMVWRATPDGEPDYINSRLANYTGRGLDGIGRGPEDLGRTLDDLVKLKVQNAMVHQDDLDAAAQAWGRAHETGALDLTARLRGADGSYRWFQARAEPMRDEAGRIVHWYGVAVDIDDRKRAEDALRKSEQELRSIVDALPQTIVVLGPDGTGLYANRPLLDYTGLTMEQLLTPDSRGNPVLFHPDDWARLQDERRQGLARSMPFEIEWRVRRKDGQYRWFLVQYHPLRDEQGRIFRWYAGGTDIDDRKRAEEALRATQAKLSRASKIATVSELAASIAHEISQPLAALVANGHAIQRWLSAEPPNLERAGRTAERVIRDGNAAAEVVNRIRALFKRTDLTRTPLDLNEVIREVNRLMADEVAARSVGIETDLADDVPPILADRVQMQQVIVNLVRNGVEAMESEESHPKMLKIRSRRDGTNSVLIEIRDQGSGLEDVERVFEPFFTTKKTGMGMGLAISRWIVEAHQGRLWATSNTPRGAVFSFTLPIASSAS
ncbi:MAG TPA: PAS domain S-box protein [Gemmatimonadales bacterium]|nr:PAS domain S-box protein [Gemmatimonadales bacterium]